MNAMPQSKSNRSLGYNEARKLLNVAQAAQIDRDRKQAGKWPGTYNLRLLAEAVNLRHKYVGFEGQDGSIAESRFTIRYDDERKAVFIKPDSKDFIPCGWFSYDSLKQALTAIERGKDGKLS